MSWIDTAFNGISTQLKSLKESKLNKNEAFKVFQKKEDAFSRKYADLEGSPELARVATSGDLQDLSGADDLTNVSLAWTLATIPSASWRSVCYGDGKYVAVAYSSNKTAYSEDGINWTATTMPSKADWYSVCYGDGKFVAVAYSSNKAAYSEDGINWTAATLPSRVSWKSVCYGDGKFVAVANSDEAAYSENGINWTAAMMPSPANWESVCYGDGKYVAIA
ncbi:MAG: hypothetical protein KBT06_00590 [Prevotellaceae bacterium]|nr:hypothetical protein [Candidatus Colivivens equi]